MWTLEIYVVFSNEADNVAGAAGTDDKQTEVSLNQIAETETAEDSSEETEPNS